MWTCRVNRKTLLALIYSVRSTNSGAGSSSCLVHSEYLKTPSESKHHVVLTTVAKLSSHGEDPSYNDQRRKSVIALKTRRSLEQALVLSGKSPEALISSTMSLFREY